MSQLDPIEVYLQVKEAADPASSWKPALQNAAIQGGTALAVAGLPLVAGAAYNAIAKRGRYNRLLEHNEDLHAMREEDPKRFNTFYNSLHSMAPTYAADPIVAGTYMRQMMSNPAGAGKVLVEARGGVKQLPSSPWVDAFRAAAPIVGKAVADGTRPVDPNEALRQQVQGLELNKKHKDLTSVDPNEALRQQVQELELGKKHKDLTSVDPYEQERRDIENARIQMQHQDTMTEAYKRGIHTF